MSAPAFRRSAGIGALTLLATLSVAPGPDIRAASHSDAPLIKQDPQANITDVYAFIGTKYDDPSENVLNVVVQVRPFSEPGDGVVYDRFADDALYSIHIADPTTGKTLTRYDFRFSDVNPGRAPALKNPQTILSYGLGTELGPILTPGDPRQNYTQTYSVTRVTGRASKVLARGLLTPPPNVGRNTTPAYNDPSGRAVSGARSLGELDPYTAAAVYSLRSGEAVFAGPREDGFYADTPAIFDLLDVRILDNNGNLGDGLGQDGGGVDGFKGFNVLAFAIQIPVSGLPTVSYSAPFADLAEPLPALDTANGVGVYASVSRQATRVLRERGDPANFGPWVQVNRMGNPLFNELLVSLKDKDNYNRAAPTEDAKRFGTYAQSPEVAALINTVYGTGFAVSGRSDLAAVYIPDVIRVDTTTGPVRLSGQPGYSRLGFAGGDTTTDADGRVKSSGWPNGRRLGDDVVDIALTAVASGPEYGSVTLVGDNSAGNDQVYHLVFPYAATPNAGPTNRKDP